MLPITSVAGGVDDLDGDAVEPRRPSRKPIAERVDDLRTRGS